MQDDLAPFPHVVIDDAIDPQLAYLVRDEILTLPLNMFDRLNNYFEQKYLLRVKTGLPHGLSALFAFLESDEFVAYLSKLSGFNLKANKDRHFHGVHIFDNNDYLDVHCDAARYAGANKTVTVGLYLSKNWQEGAELEIWEGESCKNFVERLPSMPKLTKLRSTIFPKFNRMVIFVNNEVAWHGVSKPQGTNPDDARRVFVTASYLCYDGNDIDGRAKALFVKRPGDPEDAEKDAIRIKRADPATFSQVHRMLDGQRKR